MSKVTAFIILILCLCIKTVFSTTDGPYVFYKGDKIVVKTVTFSGLKTEEYNNTENVTITCKVPSTGDVFSFPLRKNHTPNPATYPVPTKILATSDLEGNFEGLANVLKAAKVIDDNLNWIYGTGRIAMPGDLFDRGEEVTESFWLLYKLQAEAEAAGGGVHYLLGNHDLWNLTGEYKDVEPKYMNTAQIIGEGDYGSLFAKNTELGKWLRARNTVMKLGNYTFVHAGISPKIVSAKISIDEINSVVRKKVAGKSTSNTSLITKTLGPLWYRGYFKSGSGSSGSYNKATSSEMSKIVDFLGCTRIFVGHTKQDNMKLQYGGKVIGIDIYSNHGSPTVTAFLYENGKGYSFKSSTKRKSLLFTDEVAPTGFQINVTGGDFKKIPQKDFYTEGETVTLLPQKTWGLFFTGWGGDTCSFNDTLTFKVMKDRNLSLFFHTASLKEHSKYGLAGGNRAADSELQKTFYGYSHDGAKIDTTALRSDSSVFLQYTIPTQPNDTTWPGIGLATSKKNSLKGMTHIRLTYRSSDTLHTQLQDSGYAPFIKKIAPTKSWKTIEIPIDEFTVAADWGIPVADFNLNSLTEVIFSPVVDGSRESRGKIEVAGLWLIGMEEDKVSSKYVTSVKSNTKGLDYRITNRRIEFSTPSSKARTVQIFSLSGRMLFNKTISASTESLKIPQTFAKGVSIIKVTDGITTEARQILID